MENSIVDLIAQDSSAADVSDAIKNSLYAKAAERIDAAKPYVATSMFDEPTEGEVEVEDEVTQDPQKDQE
jgi:hypothetical protein